MTNSFSAVGQLLADDRRRTLDRLGIDNPTLDLLSTLRRSGPPYRLTPSEIAARSFVTAGAPSPSRSPTPGGS